VTSTRSRAPAGKAPAYTTDEVAYRDTGEEFVGPFPSWANVKTEFGAVYTGTGPTASMWLANMTGDPDAPDEMA